MTSVAAATTQEVADLMVASIDSSMGITSPLLEKTFSRVFSKAAGGLYVLLYKYGSFVALQMFAEYASYRETTVNGRTVVPLIELGRWIGVGYPAPAVRCEANITIAVTTQTGSIAAGAQLVNPETGILYTTTAAVALSAATVQVAVRASLDGAGEAGQLVVGDQLSFANPLPNVSANTTVALVTVSGEDGETEDAYRTRVTQYRKSPPQGGAYADYRIWCESVSGIVSAYPYTGAPGEVNVYVEASVASSGSADGIPTGPQLSAVDAYVQGLSGGLATRRSVLAAVNILPITRKTFDLIVTGLVVSDVASAKTSAQEAVDAFLREREPYIEGLSSLPRLDRVTAADASGIVSSAVGAFGGTVTAVALESGVGAVTSYTLSDGEKAKLGTITYA